MNKKDMIILPALRGRMGDWIYYSALMNIVEISKRVSFTNDIYKNKSLSDMIQRSLDETRGKEIAKYIRDQKERFFNSLVIAIYDGEPNWYEVSSVKALDDTLSTELIDEATLASVGLLTLRGDESLFAIDGQHRLAGIKRATGDGFDQADPDDLSVIFVAHNQSEQGLERTRRLFTTLNKTAKPVSKGDIIALDEDDVMAICARRLIEKTTLFGGTRIAFVPNNNMPATNLYSLTTIGNLYDVLTMIFTKFPSPLQKHRKDLQINRPPDEKLDNYFEYAVEFFKLLGKALPELQEFFDSKDTKSTVRDNRGTHGGSAIFRPIGIEIFVEIISRLMEKYNYDLEQAIELVSRLPRKLGSEPYAGLMWDTGTRTIINRHKVTLREVLCHMVGCSQYKYKEEELLQRYQSALGDETITLPSPVI